MLACGGGSTPATEAPAEPPPARVDPASSFVAPFGLTWESDESEARQAVRCQGLAVDQPAERLYVCKPRYGGEDFDGSVLMQAEPGKAYALKGVSAGRIFRVDEGQGEAPARKLYGRMVLETQRLFGQPNERVSGTEDIPEGEESVWRKEGRSMRVNVSPAGPSGDWQFSITAQLENLDLQHVDESGAPGEPAGMSVQEALVPDPPAPE
jgi:hypothetical protein